MLNYTFELSKDQTAINVTLEYTASPLTDTVKLIIPANYNRNSLDTVSFAKDIKLVSKGQLIKNSLDTYSYIGTEKTFVIRYSISSFSDETRYLPCEDDDYFLPIINKEFFHFYSDKALILPDAKGANDTPFKIEVNWLNFPEEWEIANDFGVLEKKKNRYKQIIESATIGEISQILFIGGNYRKTLFTIDGINFHTFAYGDYNFPDSSVTHLLEKVAKSNLDLWNHFGRKNDYVISLTQKGDVCGRIGGRNMYNSFSIYMSGKFTEDYLPNVFIKAFTHEFTHTWIGTDFVSNNENWEKMKWFVEGFCDYYSWVINVDIGIVPSRKLKVLINQNYIKYRLSPYANEPLDFYSENYRYSNTLENIAYTKGATFAFYLDGYIRTQTNSKYNLTGFMTTLIKSKERINSNLNLELMNEIAVETLGIDITDILHKYIVNGEVIPLESPLIETSATKEYTSFDYGFDFIESARTEIISGVKEDGNAYKSGLRNGQKLLSIKNITNKASGSIILEVTENGESLIIEYNPVGETLNLTTIQTASFD